MTDIGIAQLKANLSEYVKRAAAGERIRVTDRGVPKAMLTALTGESRIEQGIREGWITPGANFGKPRPPVRLLGLKTKDGSTVQDMMDEDRGE